METVWAGDKQVIYFDQTKTNVILCEYNKAIVQARRALVKPIYVHVAIYVQSASN